MTINQINWGKTILTAYSYLERMCDAIDVQINDSALNSFYSHGYGKESNSVFSVCDKIIELSSKKVKYINLKVATEMALKKMPKKLAKVLILKYVYNIQGDQLAMSLGLNTRTMFRHINKAVGAFCFELGLIGYTNEKIELEFFNDIFLKSIYDLLCKDVKCITQQEQMMPRDVSSIGGFIKEICAYI